MSGKYALLICLSLIMNTYCFALRQIPGSYNRERLKQIIRENIDTSWIPKFVEEFNTPKSNVVFMADDIGYDSEDGGEYDWFQKVTYREVTIPKRQITIEYDLQVSPSQYCCGCFFRRSQ